MVIGGHKFIKASLHFTSQYLSGSTQMIKFKTVHSEVKHYTLVRLNSLS